MRLSRFLFIATAFGVPLAGTSSVFAHESWLEPLAYQVETQGDLTADLKNGEEFVGSTLGYFPNNIVRFDMIMGETAAPVEARPGNIPALETAAPAVDGLLVLVYQSTPSSLKYAEWEKFLAFAEHKDFKIAEAAHLAAGWPQQGFGEVYSRYIKSLVAVGNGEGTDMITGMETELVALTNPYSAAFDGTMQVQVLYKAQPRADAQVEIFRRTPEGEVDITLTRTNAEGVASIPVSPGSEYLLDAVVLRPYSGDRDAVWETLWAALTFKVPE
ncbi:DUF4198 domain-containing protein [Pseudosulfitobacter koreensis]|uniref:DUF4198 domain-containing protein n=1 Tax=Pseudosulfitobacter koreensis TaxID=2968472 RepID=A0ABT1Z254_9RHOB|nr:DUF4198 domain-containing protein [Pseudosulfitobacter koreense]MCR8827214.1 DUF4198 domain-containing protein [Pseudosulfitobacter koreense]